MGGDKYLNKSGIDRNKVDKNKSEVKVRLIIINSNSLNLTFSLF